MYSISKCYAPPDSKCHSLVLTNRHWPYWKKIILSAQLRAPLKPLSITLV